MKLNKKKLIIYTILFICGLLIPFFFFAPAQLEESRNVVLKKPPYNASDKAKELHKKLLVVDLHADSLLWHRDLNERARRGHVDVPRLIEGNVALQGFTVVTKTPRGLNYENNDDKTDNIFLLAIAQRWPIATWNSLTERALFQSRKLHDTAAASNGKLTIIKTAADLNNYLTRRASDPTITAGFLGIEGAQALDGKLENIDRLFDAGFRMMAPTHFYDNELGGSAHGVQKGGLTEMGKEMIRRMEAKHMIIDIAHASPKTIDDVLAIATKPIFVSHTGVKGTCNNSRNISDEHLKAIAKNGGLVGIGYWDTAICGTKVQDITRAIKYTVDLIGVKHVALGSDYDGSVTVPFDTTGLVLLTDALLAEGFSEEDIALIMGGNALRLMKENLPQ